MRPNHKKHIETGEINLRCPDCKLFYTKFMQPRDKTCVDLEWKV